MRRGASSPLSSRSYRVGQPTPRKHQSPALLRIAGVQHARAEQAEQERRDWQQRYEEQAAELVQLRVDLATQKQYAADQLRAHAAEKRRLITESEQQKNVYGNQLLAKQQQARAAEMDALRHELTEKLSVMERERAEALEQLDDITEERDVLRDQLAECEASFDELREEAEEWESEAEMLRQQSEENARLVKENAALRTKMEQTERAHKEVSEVADSQRRTIRYEQQRRTELEHQLDQALKAPKTPPPNHHDGGSATSAWAAHQRAEQLAVENQQLRRHRDAVAHERERIANRILRIMSPGQYLDHATAAGYDPTNDPLIQQKRRELGVLDHYSRWQKKYMKRVTARQLKEQRTLDEQAIEAALTDRWKLITKPLVSLGAEPSWRIIGFMLDERSEAFLRKQSEDRCRKMMGRMNW